MPGRQTIAGLIVISPRRIGPFRVLMGFRTRINRWRDRTRTNRRGEALLIWFRTRIIRQGRIFEYNKIHVRGNSNKAITIMSALGKIALFPELPSIKVSIPNRLILPYKFPRLDARRVRLIRVVLGLRASRESRGWRDGWRQSMGRVDCWGMGSRRKITKNAILG